MESYEVWDVTIPPIPSRSRLYCLDPVGIGTPDVESLTSYITRIANAHYVPSGLLVSKEIFPLVPGYAEISKYHGVFSDVGRRSNYFNGLGLPASQAVQALKQLTLRTDLSSLTCLSLAKILSSRGRGLIRQAKAWCAVCYEEQRSNSQIIYDPLIWSFQDVLICSRHHLYLNTVCTYFDCGKSLPGVAWHTYVGYCSSCYRWLGLSLAQAREISHAPAKAELHWQLWVIKSLGDLFPYFTNEAISLRRQRVQQVVEYLFQKVSVGNISALAKALGMSRNMIDYWRQGEKIPEIDMLLHFCFRLNISLYDFFCQELDSIHPKLIDLDMFMPIKHRRKSVVQTEAVYQALELAAKSDEYPPPSLKIVTFRVGHTQQILHKVNPSASQKIVNRYNAYIQERKEANFCLYENEIRKIALQLCNSGIVPTQKRIAPLLSQSGILRHPQLREYLHRTCQEVIQSNKKLES